VPSDRFIPTSPRFCGRSARYATSFEVNARAEKGEWVHAMNIYRDTAILYLNRLAYPHVPSAHSIFQREVQQVTYRLISLWHFKY